MNRCHECGEPPAHEVLAALEAWFKAYPGTIPFLRELIRHVCEDKYCAALGDLCAVIENMHIKAVGTRTRPAIYGGSHSGGKMHMTEQQNKALLEKDPDYVAKLMTPANTPGKSDDGLRGALMQAEFNELPNKCPGCDGPTAEIEHGWWHSRCREAFKRGKTESAAAFGSRVHEVAERYVSVDYEKHEIRTVAHMLVKANFHHVELLPGKQVKGFDHPSHSVSYQVIVVNGVGITGVDPGSVVHQNIEKALRTEPEPSQDQRKGSDR